MEISTSWACDPRDYSKEQYGQLLEKLSQLPKGCAYSLKSNSFERIGRINQIWQRVRSLFGFENRASYHKVNYELLKLLRYGVQQELFHDRKLKQQATVLADRLQQNKKMHVVAETIEKILKQPNSLGKVNETIHCHFQKRRKSLKPALWNSIFRSAPTSMGNSARYYLNLASEAYSKKNFSLAIEKGTQITDAPPALAEQSRRIVALSHIALSEDEPLEEAIKSLQEGLKALEPSDTALQISIHEKCAALYQKNGQLLDAINALEDALAIDNSSLNLWRELMLKLVKEHSNKKDWDTVYSLLEQVIERAHLTQKDLAKTLPLLFTEGRFKEIQLLADYCRSNGVVMDFLAREAKVLQEAKKQETALLLLAFALDNDPESQACREALVTITFQLIIEALAKSDLSTSLTHLDRLHTSLGLNLAEMRHLIALLEERGYPLAAKEIAEHLHFDD